MVLGENDFLPLSLGLKVMLWMEVVIYLVFGFLIFFRGEFKAAPAYLRNNAEIFKHTTGEQIHACLAIILGYVAFQGVLSGQVTRFELEMSFVILGMLMGMIMNVPTGLELIYVLKPETYFTTAMWVFYSGYVRWPVLVLAGFLTLFGVYKKLFVTRKLWGSYEVFRKEMLDIQGPDGEELKNMDKLARYKAQARGLSEPILAQV